MKKRILSTILSLTLAISMAGILSGCSTETQGESNDLMADLQTDSTESDTDANEPEPAKVTPDFTGREHIAVSDFSVKLFRQSLETDKNMLISPVSVIYALGMTANGAKENTLSQMEMLFSLPIDTLNHYLSDYIKQLPTDEYYKLHIANSIWFKDDKKFTVEPDFLQANEDFYDAGIYQVPFDDATVKEINDWIEENTDGMISDMLKEIPEDTIMYLVNALAFDADWETIYYDYNVANRTFTKEDGTEQDVELMYSSERDYLEDDNATGFIKYYKDRKYAFAALLPNEGVTISEYVSTLTGEHLYDMLSNPRDIEVNAAIPKFETEYNLNMNDTLKNMGMTDAFDLKVADFSGIGSHPNGNIAINKVLHKTFITVDEKGTKAGAATMVEMICESAALEPEEVKTVYLDRPFVYMLIDCESNLPIFIGTLMDAAQ